jgi:hypothetical protein
MYFISIVQSTFIFIKCILYILYNQLFYSLNVFYIYCTINFFYSLNVFYIYCTINFFIRGKQYTILSFVQIIVFFSWWDVCIIDYMCLVNWQKA